MRAALLAPLLVLASLIAGCASDRAPAPGAPSMPTDAAPAPPAPVEALNRTVDFSADPGGADRPFPFRVPEGHRNVTMRVSFAPATPASPIVSLKVQLVDASGKETGEGAGDCDLGSGAMTVPSTCERAAPASAGDWKVVASGSGAATARIVVRLE